MKKNISILFLSLLLIIGLAIVLPQLAVAAPVVAPNGGANDPNSNAGALAKCADNEVQTDFGCFPNDPIGFVQKFYGYGLSFVAMVSLLTLILGGYDILTSKGEPRRVNIGKSYIFYSIGGLLLAIFGYVIIRVIAVDLLKVPGFK